MKIKEIIEIMVAESVQENSSTNNRVIIEQDFEIVAEEILKKLNTEDESKCACCEKNKPEVCGSCLSDIAQQTGEQAYQSR